MKHFRPRRVLLALALLGSLAGQFVNAATVGVRIGDYFFSPTNLVINAGDKVNWTNKSVLALHDTTHNVVSNRLWASTLLGFNGSFSFTLSNAGYYPYMCQQHVVINPIAKQQTGSISVVSFNITSPPDRAQIFAGSSLDIQATASS